MIKLSENIVREILEGKQVFTRKDLPDLRKAGLVEIYDKENNFVAVGYINPRSNLALRIISYERDFDIFDLFVERLKKAKRRRERFYKHAYRWIYSEADFLSGLIIDKYDNIAVIENSNPFFEKYLDKLVEAIIQVDSRIDTVYFKGDYRSRINEGLLRINKFLYGNCKETEIRESKARFIVNVVLGQKTGFFLDQRENRLLFGRLVWGKILDVFSYTGGFGIQALLNSEVEEVWFIEKDKKAIELLKRNLELNDVKDKARIVEGDAFKILRKLNEKFDVINLDPAGLAVTGSKKSKAMKSLYIINRLAFKLLKRDSLLVTSDCSYHIKREEFRKLIFKVVENKKNLIYEGRQAFDHPVHPKHKELEYLKTLFLY